MMTHLPSSAETLTTVRDLWRYGFSTLHRAPVIFGHGFPGAWEESRQLLLHTLALPRDEDPSPWLEARVLPEERQQFLSLLDKRVRLRIPVAYLTQEAWLGDHAFYCDERVLIPRSFLAELLDDGLDFLIEDWQSLTHVADICTGGGSLAILLALKCPHAQVDATDISPAALAVAGINRERYRLEERVQLLCGDLMAPLGQQTYDLILSNPPYVDAEAMATLPEEYRQEPELALVSGMDGLEHVTRLLHRAADHLTPEGWLIVEVGHQADKLEVAFPHLPFIWLDLNGGGRHVFALAREALQP